MPDLYDTETHLVLESQDIAALLVDGALDPRYLILGGGGLGPILSRVAAVPVEDRRALPMTPLERGRYTAGIHTKFRAYIGNTQRKPAPPAVAPVEP